MSFVLSVMMVILSVLKVIGIVLLIFLALILLIVCLVLFGPVTLRFNVVHETERLTEGWQVSGAVSWLRFVLKAAFSYDESVNFSLRVFGVQVFPKKEKPEKEKPEKDGQRQKPKGLLQPQEEPAQIPEQILITEKTAEENQENPEEGERQEEEKEPEEASKDAKKEKESGKEKRPKKEKKPKKGKKSGGESKTSDILQKVRGVLEDESFRPAVSVIFSSIGGFLRRIRIFDLKGEASYSLGSPDLTGMATGVISLFPAAYGEELTLEPDFAKEEISFSGHLAGGGSIRLIHVLIMGVKIISDKNIRKMVQLIQK